MRFLDDTDQFQLAFLFLIFHPPGLNIDDTNDCLNKISNKLYRGDMVMFGSICNSFLTRSVVARNGYEA